MADRLGSSRNKHLLSTIKPFQAFTKHGHHRVVHRVGEAVSVSETAADDVEAQITARRNVSFHIAAAVGAMPEACEASKTVLGGLSARYRLQEMFSGAEPLEDRRRLADEGVCGTGQAVDQALTKGALHELLRKILDHALP